MRQLTKKEIDHLLAKGPSGELALRFFSTILEIGIEQLDMMQDRNLMKQMCTDMTYTNKKYRK